jgi:uncharacterized protein
MNPYELGLTPAIIGFAQLAREKGLNVGIEETLTALKTFDLGVFENKVVFYFTLKTLFCTSKDDFEIFDKLFKTYWEGGQAAAEQRSKRMMQGADNLPKQKSILTIAGQGEQEEDENEDTKTVTGANGIERLRQTDFSKITEMETPILEEIAEKLWREMAKRLKRRQKTSRTKETIDVRRTIRDSLEHGGNPIELYFKGKKPKKMRLVLLLDVSGSMDKYSFFLLRFICALQSYFEKVESFVFSTHLRRITDYLNAKGIDETLELLSKNADNWSSGTKIGESFRQFNDIYAKRLLSRSSYVIILSDGLDTGEKDMIQIEAEKINRRTKQVIWLNPLKGTQGYQPTARGMSEAMPHIDHFKSAHNLNSILELEDFLFHV